MKSFLTWVAIIGGALIALVGLITKLTQSKSEIDHEDPKQRGSTAAAREHKKLIAEGKALQKIEDELKTDENEKTDQVKSETSTQEQDREQ